MKNLCALFTFLTICTCSLIANTALQFTGSSQHVAVTDAPAFDIDTDFTIETWIRTTGGGQQGVVTQGLDAGNGYAFFVLGGSVYFQYYSGGGYNNGASALGVAANINDGNWHHIAVVIDGTNGKLFVDGIKLQEITSMNAVDESTSNIHFGYHPSVGQFSGNLDEVRFWDYARSAVEISSNMNSCITMPTSGLVASYNFEDGSGSVLTDVSGNGNNGTLTNMDPVQDWVSSGYTCGSSAPSNNGLDFDGTDDYVVTSAFTSNSDMTFSAWIYPRNYNLGTLYPRIFSNFDGTDDLILWSNGSNFGFGSASLNQKFEAGSAPAVNQWTQVTVTRSGAALKIYFNGVEQSTSISPFSWNTSAGINSLFIGAGMNSTNAAGFFDGQIDNVGIWNYAMNDSEVLSLNTTCINGTEAGLITYFEFEDGAGSSSVTDISGNGNTGTLTNMDINGDWISSSVTCNPPSNSLTLTYPNGGEILAPGASETITWGTTGSISLVDLYYSTDNGSNWNFINDNLNNNGSYSWTVPNVSSTQCLIRIVDTSNPTTILDESDAVFTIGSSNSNTALEFTASSEHVVISDAPAFDIDTDFTIEAWLKTTAGGQQGIVTQGLDAGNGYAFFVLGSSVYFQYYSGGGYNNGSTSALGIAANINDGNWHHIAVVIDGSNGKMYVDGSMLQEITAMNAVDESTSNIHFGYHPSVGQFTGSLDEIRFWNYARSVSEINADMNTCLSSGTTGLMASYNFEDGAGNTLTDHSGNGNNGTLTNMDGNTDWVSSGYTCGTSSATEMVIAPNGGETLTGGSSYQVTWSAPNLTDINLDYSTDNGATWINILSEFSASTNGYSWTVPNVSSTQCLMRIVDHWGTLVGDTSDATFTITPAVSGAIVINSPNGGENFGVNSYRYINWSSTNVSSVDVDYSLDNGSSWNNIVSGINNTGYYYWNVPGTPSNQALVRVTDPGNTTVTDQSDATFNIISPSITINSPNGGETFVGCDVETVSWTGMGTSGAYRVQFSTDNGSSWSYLSSYTTNTSINWNVPNLTSSSCIVRVADYYAPSINDASNNVFSISQCPPSLDLVSPNGGQVWPILSAQQITWTSTNVDFIKIEYSFDAGTSWNILVSNQDASTGSFNWFVPFISSNDYLVRITDASNSALTDQSAATFSIITPDITITDPNGGEVFTGLTSQIIQWTSLGTSSYVKLEYSTDAGSSWNTITSWTFDDGSYNWQIPNTASTNCLIRVSDYYTNSLKDVSDGTFEIQAAPAAIIVNSPNGGEVWGVGTEKYISWNSSSVSNINLEYSTDGGTSWNSITNGLAASSSYYLWTVPNTASTNCYVRATDASNGSISDMSDSPFEIITPNISVTSPNGGESLTEGNFHTITWTNVGIANYVEIEYSTDNGATWNDIASPLFNTGSYNWHVPFTPSSNCLIKVSDHFNTATSDSSNGTFTILQTPPAINLTYPNGGQTLATGQQSNIYWNSSNVSDVMLEYSDNNGSNWNTIVASTPASSGGHNWTVPSITSANYLIRVSDVTNSSLYDESNNVFSVEDPFIEVNTPDGGEIFQIGTYTYIGWTSLGVSSVNIEFSEDNGSTWDTVVTNYNNYGYYYWNIPNNESTNCLIRVSSSDSVQVSDESDATFTIIPPTPSVTLTHPNGGQVWYTGHQYYINWYQTAVDNVQLEYSTDSGGTWNTIVTSTNASFGFYYWTVPNTVSDQCYIRISDVTDPSVADTSNFVFSIEEPVPSLTVNYPNGGETFYQGAYQYISWSNNFVSAVNVQFSTDSGSTWNTIAINHPSNYYYWNIPVVSSNDCYIKVISSTDGSVVDSSDAVFTIDAAPVNSNVLSTDSIVPMVFCKEDTIQVYYTASGVYNSGNTFSVQLSDSTGNFSNATIIGTMASTALDSSISCVVPSHVWNGSNYRIRVVGNDLPVIGSDNGTDIIISSPQFDFVASETEKFLPNGHVDFTYIGDTTGMANYAWDFGDGSTSSDINPSHNYSGIVYFTVSLTVTDNQNCSITREKNDYIRVERLLQNADIGLGVNTNVSSVSFIDQKKGYVSMEDGSCYVTLDSGATWMHSPTGLGSPLTSTSFADSAWFVVGSGGEIVQSTDKGDTWLSTFAGSSETFNSIDLENPTNGFVVGTNGTIFSFDGTSWTPQPSGVSEELRSVKSINGKAFAVGFNGTILHYDGTSWTPQTSPVSSSLNEVFIVNENRGYATGLDGKILSYDGTSWEVALSGVDVDFTSITAFGNDSAWACGNGGIVYRTLDGGTTWDRMSIGANKDLKRIYYLRGDTGPNRAQTSGRGYVVGDAGDARWFTGSDFITNANDTTTTDTTGTNPSGIQVSSFTKKMVIYPNPTQNVIHFNLDVNEPIKLVVNLKNLEGRLVDEIINEKLWESGVFSYDVSNLSSGVYFVHVSQGNLSWVQKLVVNH